MDETHALIIHKPAEGKRINLAVIAEAKNLLEQADRQTRFQRRQERRRHAKHIDGVTDAAIASPQENFADLVFRIDIYRQIYAAAGKLTETLRHGASLYSSGSLT